MNKPAPPERTHEQTILWMALNGSSSEVCNLAFENNGWTADGRVAGPDVHWVIRTDANWSLRQFMLFRDLEEADLWLATDGHARWLEVNGAPREDLEGCTDVALDVTPFAHSVLIRRLGLPVGGSAEIQTAQIDVHRLGVVPTSVRYERVGSDRWQVHAPGETIELHVDDDGLVIEQTGRFRRVGA